MCVDIDNRPVEKGQMFLTKFPVESVVQSCESTIMQGSCKEGAVHFENWQVEWFMK